MKHEQSASDVEQICREIKETLAVEKVPALYEAMSVFPAYLATSWRRYTTIMTAGELVRADKELVGFAAAIAQGNDYMISFQRERLKSCGVSNEQIVEALAVVDFFEGFDAFAHALHVDSDLRPRPLMAGDMSLVDVDADVNVCYVVQSEDATVNRVYDEIKSSFGIPFIPNIFKALAHVPAALEVKWQAYRTIMLGGKLGRRTKELLAVAVSAVNACHY